MHAAEDKNIQIMEELNGDVENIALKLRDFIRHQITDFKELL